MNKPNYLQRFMGFFIKGIIAGIPFTLIMTTISSGIGAEFRYRSNLSWDRISDLILHPYLVLPSTLIAFAISIIIIALILALTKNQPPVSAIFIGIIVGAAIILTIDYLSWLVFYGKLLKYPYYHFTFIGTSFLSEENLPLDEVRHTTFWIALVGSNYLASNIINILAIIGSSYKMVKADTPRKVFTINDYLLIVLTIICLLSFFISILGDGLILFIFNFPRFGILPAILACYIVGVLMANILVRRKKRLSNAYSVILGIMLGLIITIIASYVLWVFAYSSILIHSDWWHVRTFYEFLDPRNAQNIIVYLIRINPFFIPGILGIFFSGYVGWKINNDLFPQNLLKE